MTMNTVKCIFSLQKGCGFFLNQIDFSLNQTGTQLNKDKQMEQLAFPDKFITYFWKNILSTFTGRFNTFSIVNHEIFLKIILVLNIFEKYKFQYRLLEKKSSIPG